MILLTEKDIRGLMSMREAIAAAKEALTLHAAGGCDVPLRTNLDVAQHGGQALFMPAHVPQIDAVGIKIVSVFPGNAARGLPAVPAKVVLLDATTGDVAAILDGTYLTALRTGAVQGAATDTLARADARTGALIGAGGQAFGQLEAMLAARTLTHVRVHDRDGERCAAFVDDARGMASGYGAELSVARTAEEAVEGADVVTAATTSPVPVFDPSALGPGVHVNGVGAYTPAMQELPSQLVAGADLLTIDTAAALDEAGDLIAPIEAGLLEPTRAVPLGEVLGGRAPGRTADGQTTVFKTVGSAVLDVVTAHRVLQAAVAAGVGHRIDL